MNNLNGIPDQRLRIDLSQPGAVEHWTHSLNVTHEQLKAAIDKVGNLAHEVMDYLGSEMEDRYGDEYLFYHGDSN
jgi:uncharacterized protein DUF3606